MSPGCLLKTTEVHTHPVHLNGFLLNNETHDYKIKTVKFEYIINGLGCRSFDPTYIKIIFSFFSNVL